jgi:VanZ family protein
VKWLAKTPFGRSKVMAFTPAIIWSVVMIYFSLLPGSDVPTILVETDDIILHVGMYFICFVLYYLGLIGWNIEHKPTKTGLWIVLSLSILAGGGIEVLQENFIPKRVGSLADLISNISGSLLGLLICIVWHRKQLKNLHT